MRIRHQFTCHPWDHANSKSCLVLSTREALWHASSRRSTPGLRATSSRHSLSCTHSFGADRKPCHKNDDQKVKDYGVTLAVDMINRIVREGGIPGVHICTLNLERSVQRVLEALHWAGGSPKIGNRLIIVSLAQQCL